MTKKGYTCGQNPGKGQYVCASCGKELFIDKATETLPPCAKCKKCIFRKEG